MERDYNANIDLYLELLADAVDNLSPGNQASAIAALKEAAELDADLMAEEKKLLDRDNDFARSAERFINRVSDTALRAKTKRQPSESTQSVAALRQAALDGKITPEEAGDAFVYLGGAPTRRAAFIDAITTEVGRLADRAAAVESRELKSTAAKSKLSG